MSLTVKRAQDLLYDVVQTIVSERLKPGDKLPQQAEMARRFGVGASPVREALRMLEVAGLVSLKPGPAAGATLGEANAEHLAALAAAFLSISGVTYGQVMEAWGAAEALLASAAAANPDRTAVQAELAQFAAEPESDEPVPATHAMDFHDAVARAAGNPALGLVLQVLSYVVADLYWSATDALPPGRPVRHDHHEIAEAILAGDPRQAWLCMESHARATAEGILARVGRLPDEPFLWTRRRVGTAAYRQRPPMGGAIYSGANGGAR